MDPTPVKKARWTTAEETTLIQAVSERESRLFGSMSGCGTLKTKTLKDAAWVEVADILNSQFFSEKRDMKTVKKKYYNLKGKAKAKRDAVKRTGGGPAETLSQAEALLLDKIGDRASVCGVTGFIDTDAPEQPFIVTLQDSPNEKIPETHRGTEMQAEEGNNRQIDSQQITGTEKHPIIMNKKSTKRTYKNYKNLAEETLLLDKERIQLELQLLKEKINYKKIQTAIKQKEEVKLNLEIETLQQQKELQSLKKEVLHFKLKGFLDFDFSHM